MLLRMKYAQIGKLFGQVETPGCGGVPKPLGQLSDSPVHKSKLEPKPEIELKRSCKCYYGSATTTYLFMKSF